MPFLLDNKGQGKVGDALRENIHNDAQLSIISGAFSVYAYTSLNSVLSNIKKLRLLVSSNSSEGFKVDGLTGG